MPSTVADIFAAAEVRPAGVARWQTSPKPPKGTGATATGVYVVALTNHLDRLNDAVPAAPIAASAIDELLMVRPELRMNGARPSREELAARLGAFWCPDEVVLYIGRAGPRKGRGAGDEVANRVREYCGTALGARAPHAGGWPLKTLSCLSELWVHYGYCADDDDAEERALRSFAAGLSDGTRAALHDSVRVMPFANLEFPKGKAKGHGIRGAREPRKRPTARSGAAGATP